MSDSMGSSHLAIANQFTDLPCVADWLNAWMQQHAVGGRTAQRVDLCCTEALTNIIMHGYDRADMADAAMSQQIRLRLDRDGDAVVLEIEDEARAFDPAQPVPTGPTDTLDDAKIGGWGLPIIHRFSDTRRYRRDDGRNRLVLLFRPADGD